MRAHDPTGTSLKLGGVKLPSGPPRRVGLTKSVRPVGTPTAAT